MTSRSRFPKRLYKKVELDIPTGAAQAQFKVAVEDVPEVLGLGPEILAVGPEPTALGIWAAPIACVA